MNEEDKRDLAVIGFIFVTGVIIYCLYTQVSTQKKVINEESIILKNSLYKCKMIKTLKELEKE